MARKGDTVAAGQAGHRGRRTAILWLDIGWLTLAEHGMLVTVSALLRNNSAMGRSDDSDARLLARVPAPEAVAALYERHVDAVFKFAVRRCRDPEDVADLVATVCLEVFASASTYDRRRGGARAWLLGIAVRCLADQQRAGYRRAELERRLAGAMEFDRDEYEAVEAAIDAARAAPAAQQALTGDLTEAERELFLLVAEDGLSVAEAARAVGLAAGAGRMRLARARRKLRSALGGAARDRHEMTMEGGRQ